MHSRGEVCAGLWRFFIRAYQRLATKDTKTRSNLWYYLTSNTLAWPDKSILTLNIVLFCVFVSSWQASLVWWVQNRFYTSLNYYD